MKCAILSALASALLLSATGTHAQGWAWGNAIAGTDTYAQRVATDASGNVIVTTSKSLAKYSPSGSLLWKKDASNGFNVSPSDVCTDAVGNIYITGSYDASTMLGTTTLPNAGGYDAFIAKCDAGGNVLWANNGSSSNEEIGMSIAVDASGNVYMGGNFTSMLTFGSTILNSVGSYSGFLTKYNSAGVPQWAKKMVNDGTTDASCGVAALAVDNSGNILITGRFTGSSVNFGTLAYTSSAFMYADMFVAKYNATGDAQWAKGGGSSYYDGAADIAVDAAGNCFVVGFFAGSSMNVETLSAPNPGGSGMDGYIVSFTAAGTLRWLEAIGTEGETNLTAAAVDAMGNVYVGGSFNGASLVFGPTTVSNIGSSTWDMMIGRFSSVGTKEWITKLGGSGDETVTGLAIDGSGNLVVEGDFNTNTLTIGASTITWTGSSFRDVLVAKYNSTTGVPETMNSSIAVNLYPNPAEDEIIVKAGDPIKELRISDLCGRIVHDEIGNKNEMRVNISKLPAGVYNVVVNGAVANRFVKN